VVKLVTEISRLKQKAISYMKLGEIAEERRDLVFFLDHREINRIQVPELTGFTNSIIFNRHGITSGGVLVLKFNRTYRIVIEEISGNIHVE
jgi:hypothetical protein